jgi:hypothetical protein
MKHFPLSLPQQIEAIAELHLTGSRFFQTNNASSDWDFIVETNNEEAVRDLLKSANSLDISAPYIKSKTTLSEVWRYWDSKLGQIDFQLCANTKQKLAAQNWIKSQLENGFAYPENKIQQVKLWETAFTVVDNK